MSEIGRRKRLFDTNIIGLVKSGRFPTMEIRIVGGGANGGISNHHYDRILFNKIHGAFYYKIIVRAHTVTNQMTF